MASPQAMLASPVPSAGMVAVSSRTLPTPLRRTLLSPPSTLSISISALSPLGSRTTVRQATSLATPSPSRMSGSGTSSTTDPSAHHVRWPSSWDSMEPMHRRANAVSLSSTVNEDGFFKSPTKYMLRPARQVVVIPTSGTPGGQGSLRRLWAVREPGAADQVPVASNELCAICLDPLRPGESVQPMVRCQHLFHAACVHDFVKAASANPFELGDRVKCPLCRGRLATSTLSEVPQVERDSVVALDASLAVGLVHPASPLSVELTEVLAGRSRRVVFASEDGELLGSLGSSGSFGGMRTTSLTWDSYFASGSLGSLVLNDLALPTPPEVISAQANASGRLSAPLEGSFL